VGIAQATGQVAVWGCQRYCNLRFYQPEFGIVNIFPLPALDGGRIAFVVLE